VLSVKTPRQKSLLARDEGKTMLATPEQDLCKWEQEREGWLSRTKVNSLISILVRIRGTRVRDLLINECAQRNKASATPERTHISRKQFSKGTLKGTRRLHLTENDRGMGKDGSCL